MEIVESVEQDGTFLVDFPFTSKGGSGLPIFKRSGNGHLLVGCNGYFVDRKQDLQREKVAGNPLIRVVKTDDKGAFIHTKPCGSGKTRNDIPNIMRGRKLDQRSFVAAPNQVVAREIYQALQDYPDLAGSCSLETSDATVNERKIAGAPIVVLPYTSFLRKIGQGRIKLRKTIAIVDEYHVHQAETVALTKLLTSKVLAWKFQLHLFSATGKDSMMAGTNFEVKKTGLPMKDLKRFFEEHQDEKILFIVPGSVKDRLQDLPVDTSTCYIPVINGDSDVVMAHRPVSEASCDVRIV